MISDVLTQCFMSLLTSSSSLLVPPRLLTITASLSPVEARWRAVAEEGFVMWVRIAFTASLNNHQSYALTIKNSKEIT